MLKKLTFYIALTRLNHPIGILLLLWPTLWALWLATAGCPNHKLLFIFSVGTVLMRSAGCIINDIMDRHLDPHVARTKNRPLASGALSLKEAWCLFALLIISAFILVLQCNGFTIGLAFVGLLLTCLYPYLKRITHLPQCGLGLAFMWGIPMAFAASINTIPWAGWCLFATGILWVIVYDTIYALADRPDDLKIGIKSTAILFAHSDRLIIGALQTMFIGLMAGIIGPLFHLSKTYYSSLMIVVLLFSYQQWLIRNNEPSDCIAAFKNNHWVGLAIFLGIAMDLIHD